MQKALWTDRTRWTKWKQETPGATLKRNRVAMQFVGEVT